MPAPAAADLRFLEKHGNKWRVVVNVPAKHQKRLRRTKLKRTLETDSLAVANTLKWDIVAEFRALFAVSKKRALDPDDALAEAQRLARLRLSAHGDTEQRALLEEIADRAEELAGQPVGIGDDGEPIYDANSEEAAMAFVGIAQGKRTPLDLHHEQYLASLHVKPRTRADDERAVRYLKEWCRRNGVAPFLQTLTKRQAIRFVDDIRSVAGDLHPVTLNKYIRRLSVYWRWLEHRDEVSIDIWHGRTIKPPKETEETLERPFTEEEMQALLAGPAKPEMHDLMRVAALTGARIDAIVCLRVRDCRGGNFTFKPQKKEARSRLCPIHSALADIVERRTAGKSDDDDVFPEWPPVKKLDSKRERSFKASNHFTEYRRSVGVDDTVEGKRRSRVNFHSFRRWFATEAERADQPESTIAAVLGHKRAGVTLGVYSAGPALEQARRCVEAVRLPPMKATEEVPQAAE